MQKLAWIWAALRVRPGWSVTAGLCALACALLLPFDRDLQPMVVAWRRLPGIEDLVDVVRCFGRGEVAVLLALAVAVSGRWRLGAQMLLALGACAALTWAFKAGVLRARPTGSSFSFVSGDTSTAFALLPLLGRSWLSVAVGLALGAGVGISRVVLGYHWPADVLGGAAVGLLSGVFALHAWPQRPWSWLGRRSLWAWLAAVAWAGAAVWACVADNIGWMRVFLLVWGPAVFALAAWPWIRLRLRRPLPGGRWAAPVLACGFVVLLALLTIGSTLWDRDEPRNALAAREMLANDAWLVPTFDGAPRLHKPILPYWLMTAALRTGLPVDIACRLPAVLCMAMAVLLLGLSARRLLAGSPRGMLLAMAVLATSPLVLVSGSAATTDAALIAGIALTMWVLVQAALDGWRAWHIPVAGLGIGWALLSKGPMAIIVPVSALGGAACLPWLACWLLRRPRPAGRLVEPGAWLVLAGGLVIGSLLALAWFLPANASTDGLMYSEMIGNHVVKRAMEARESHGGKLWYYLPVLVVGCLVWLPALLVAVRGAVVERRSAWLLWSWAIPVLVILSLVQTKLPHYVLPVLWPCAVLIAAALDGASHPAWWAWGRRILLAILVIAATALLLLPGLATVAAAAGLVEPPVPFGPLVLPAFAAGLAFLVLAWLLRLSVDRIHHAAAAVTGMTALCLAIAGNIHRVEVYKPAPRMAQAILAQVPSGVPIATCGFDEPSLYFYLGPARGPIDGLGEGELPAWAAADGPGVCVAEQRALTAATRDGALPVTELARIAGYNYSSGKPVVLVLLGRKLP